MTATNTELLVEPGQSVIVLTRVLDAPRERVFAAHTDAAAISQWWGPRSAKTVVDKLEPQAGGSWRFVCEEADGDHGFHGVYHDVVENERIVNTFEYEGMPGHVILETVLFEEHDGKTKLINISALNSVEERDGFVESGVEQGANESMDRLQELLDRTP